MAPNMITPNFFAPVPEYSLAELTQTVNILPNLFGDINDSGLFVDEGVTQLSVLIEEYLGVLNLLPVKARGAPPSKGSVGRRNMRSFTIPHIPHDDVIKAEDIQGVRAYGSLNPTTYEEVYARKMQTMKNKFSITWERMKAGMLQGLLLDADGSVIYNVFNEFGISQEVFTFAFSNANFDVAGTCRQINRFIQLNLLGEVQQGMNLAMVSPEFMDALLSHPKVQTAFQYFTTLGEMNPLRMDTRREFPFQGILFREYLANTSDINGDVVEFMAPYTGIAFPQGTQSTFRTYYAPADFLETANERGLPLYVKSKPADWNRGVEILMESNPLPICRRPRLLVKLLMD